ncbi:hypothetical protein [Rhodococcus sp. NPDC058521]|uniref:hypothetical protein n=1 Tax=Rhodococcus sp. NPDC058521 TaxID=3346536 RepID=UPI003656D5CD
MLAPVRALDLGRAALTGFSGGLLTMYWRTPGMHDMGSIRPTQDGTSVARDFWMFGIGIALLVDQVGRCSSCPSKKPVHSADAHDQ